MHENKFCLHICDHLKTRGTREECAALWLRWGVHLHNIQFKQASREWFVLSSTEMNRGMCSFHFSFKLYSDQGILFDLLYFLQAESLIWQVVFILEINSCQQLPAMISFAFRSAECKWYSNVTPKAGKVNLLYHTSNRGQFLFHNLQICWVKSNMKFTFCAIQLILVCFWSNYTSALISCISLSHNKGLHWTATHSASWMYCIGHMQDNINALCTG